MPAKTADPSYDKKSDVKSDAYMPVDTLHKLSNGTLRSA